MKYLGLDVGKRNLAICIMEDPIFEDGELKYQIPLFWKDISILDEPETCKVVGCTRPSKWKNEINMCVCGMHKKRAQMLKELEEVKVRNVDEYSPFEIHTRLVETLNKFPEIFDVDYIFIENQPKDNVPMKEFASAIFAYFANGYVRNEKRRIKMIQFMSATNKINNIPIIGEKYVSDKKGSYAKRKDTAIEYCRRYCDKYMKNMLIYFETHRKKDDLSDSYLMCISGMWRYHFQDVYPTLTYEQCCEQCEKNGINVLKANGKPKTEKQVLREMERNWIWCF